MISRFITILAQIDAGDVKLPNKSDLSGPIKDALQIAFGLAGAVALLIITIAAFQYVVSSGDPQSVNKAKNTIIYALIGLVISVMAFSIVRFVVGEL